MSSRNLFLVGLTLMLVVPAARAQLRPPQQTEAPGSASKYTTQSAEAQLAGDHAKALSLADEAMKADPKDPWGYYDRGNALRALHRTEEAVAAFRDAEERSPASDVWGKSVAIWGQANVYSQDGRCQEAAPLFERYAVLVEKVDTGAADLARQFSKHCISRPSAK
jgi:tetratricopeptide (TPR) repeat protein